MGPPTCFSALCTFYLVVRVKMKGDKNHPDGSGGSGDGGVAKSANLFAELQKKFHLKTCPSAVGWKERG